MSDLCPNPPPEVLLEVVVVVVVATTSTTAGTKAVNVTLFTSPAETNLHNKKVRLGGGLKPQ